MTHGVTGDDNPGTNRSIESSETKTDADTTAALLSESLSLTNFQLSQLAIAVGDEKSGQEILSILNAVPRDNKVTHGRLYPNLDTLEKHDLIEKGTRDRRTHEYVPSAKANQLFSTYLDWIGPIEQAADLSDEVRRLSFSMTHFQLAALVVMRKADEPIGQDVKDGLEDAYACEINHGRLYPNLDVLVNLELVEKEAADRRSFSYVLTDKGRSVISARRAWIESQIDGGDV